MKTQFIQQYIAQTLEHGKTPSSVYAFAKTINIEEKEFYNHYASLDALEKDIYKRWFIEAFEQCEDAEPWVQYSARERVLAVFYTFVEVLKSQRSFVTYLKNRDFKTLPKWPSYLNALREVFIEKVKPILMNGIDSKELAGRKYLDEKYVDGLWVNLIFIIKFWVEDTSDGFEKTDAAIEKSVNLAMDLMGKGPLDAALDFGKFLFQNR